MRRVEKESVHLVVTSPPYWSIKDYGNENQIGFRDTLPDYYKRLNKVWKQCIRVLKPSCRLCINIGDQYLRAQKGGTPYHIQPLHAFLVNTIMTTFEKDVFYLGSIIWNKIPTTKTSGGASVMGSYGRPRNGYVSYNYEYIAIFKKRGQQPPRPKLTRADRIGRRQWRRLFNGTWSFPGTRQSEGIAMFPSELPYRLMRMFTYQGDTVLDPFLGTGTTSRVAFEIGRNSVGYEIGFKPPSGEDWKEVVLRKAHFYDLPEEDRKRIFTIEST